MITQPKQFSSEHSSIFQDASVVAAYVHRGAYPPETFVKLARLIDRTISPVRLLDAGCGTGQMTSGLLPYLDEAAGDQIDAVDLSAAMIEAGKAMAYGADPRVNWITGSIETVPLQPPYALIVAAASLHWMPWDKTLPRFTNLLSENGYLALVEGRSPRDPWADELTPLFAQYSMNRDFQPYTMQTVAATLAEHGYFQQVAIIETEPITGHQPLDAWIEAIHARNGFSRDRMDPAQAAEFDQKVREVLLHYCPDGEVPDTRSARIIVGKPLAPDVG